MRRPVDRWKQAPKTDVLVDTTEYDEDVAHVTRLERSKTPDKAVFTPGAGARARGAHCDCADNSRKSVASDSGIGLLSHRPQYHAHHNGTYRHRPPECIHRVASRVGDVPDAFSCECLHRADSRACARQCNTDASINEASSPTHCAFRPDSDRPATTSLRAVVLWYKVRLSEEA